MSSVCDVKINVEQKHRGNESDAGGPRQDQRSNPSSLKKSKQQRNRLLSDPTDELPKGILKNTRRVPTKRSFSECVDDVTLLMESFGLDADDVIQSFCPVHGHRQAGSTDSNYVNDGDRDDRSDFNSCDDYDDDDDDDIDINDDDHDDEDDDDKGDGHELTAQQYYDRSEMAMYHAKHAGDIIHGDTIKSNIPKKTFGIRVKDKADSKGEHDLIKTSANDGSKLKQKCDCVLGDGNQQLDKPKKTVRFDDRVYQAYYYASRLYDRRNIRYHLSTRHHPPSDQKNKKLKSKKNRKISGSSDNETKLSDERDCQQTRSQRARQSKKDKKKRSNRKSGFTGTSCDDQGYVSSVHSVSD